MESLPTELIIEQLLFLSLPDILRQCEISHRIRNICEDDRFWLLLVKRDYPEANPRNIKTSYKEFYQYATRINLYHNGKLITTRVFDQRLLSTELPQLLTEIPHGAYIVVLTDDHNRILTFGTELGLDPIFNLTKFNQVRNVYMFDTKYHKIGVSIPRMIEEANHAIRNPAITFMQPTRNIDIMLNRLWKQLGYMISR